MVDWHQGADLHQWLELTVPENKIVILINNYEIKKKN